ncbi:Regulatory protein, LysR:LysR, substrate-binding [plant metagenome]|uniref:Regulatory protein, LysR:LysR, substrate-binding n=1 Tax=plant metagenome TaxID=1297885 RepID=A0A484T5S4_9ZZZZ
MRFDLTTLQLFLAVLETGSISAAAEREHIAASALSKRISELERSAGMPLLTRHARGVAATSAGRSLARGARLMLRQAADLSAQIQDHAHGVRGHVRLFANLSSITQFLPQELKSFLAEHPGVRVDLEERVSSAVTRAVAESEADIGVFFLSDDREGLVHYPYHKDEMALLVPAGHPLARRRSLSFVQTLDYEHVGMHRGSAASFMLHRRANEANREWRVRFHATSYDALVALVHAGLGIGVMPLKALALYRQEGVKIVKLTDEWAHRRLSICLRADDTQSSAAKLLLQHLLASARAAE